MFVELAFGGSLLPLHIMEERSTRKPFSTWNAVTNMSGGRKVINRLHKIFTQSKVSDAGRKVINWLIKILSKCKMSNM